MLTTLIKTNVRQVPRIPSPGEVYISINLGKVDDVKALWDIADSVGFAPELVSIQFPNRVELHLLLHHDQREAGFLLGDDFDQKLDELAAAGISEDAVRFVYGGGRAIAA
ncbi:MAG: hypothetical protein LH679_20965 [Cyanobacteria bacterium CAN_BIN43]|jgi:hypothetical protein|nr:hypothetical protein [Cyanobacteria bacterium CAN_BIN43]